jgi:hypothetical protein
MHTLQGRRLVKASQKLHIDGNNVARTSSNSGEKWYTGVVGIHSNGNQIAENAAPA